MKYRIFLAALFICAVAFGQMSVEQANKIIADQQAGRSRAATQPANITNSELKKLTSLIEELRHENSDLSDKLKSAKEENEILVLRQKNISRTMATTGPSQADVFTAEQFQKIRIYDPYATVCQILGSRGEKTAEGRVGMVFTETWEWVDGAGDKVRVFFEPDEAGAMRAENINQRGIDFSGYSGPPQNTDGQVLQLTMKVFSKLSRGMPYSRVCELLGCVGRNMTPQPKYYEGMSYISGDAITGQSFTSGPPQSKTRTYQWTDSSGGIIKIDFDPNFSNIYVVTNMTKSGIN